MTYFEQASSTSTKKTVCWTFQGELFTETPRRIIKISEQVCVQSYYKPSCSFILIFIASSSFNMNLIYSIRLIFLQMVIQEFMFTGRSSFPLGHICDCVLVTFNKSQSINQKIGEILPSNIFFSEQFFSQQACKH